MQNLEKSEERCLAAQMKLTQAMETAEDAKRYAYLVLYKTYYAHNIKLFYNNIIKIFIYIIFLSIAISLNLIFSSSFYYNLLNLLYFCNNYHT